MGDLEKDWLSDHQKRCLIIEVQEEARKLLKLNGGKDIVIVPEMEKKQA